MLHVHMQQHLTYTLEMLGSVQIGMVPSISKQNVNETGSHQPTVASQHDQLLAQAGTLYRSVEYRGCVDINFPSRDPFNEQCK